MKTYSESYSPCCDEPGHRPGSTGPFFCMACGKTFEDKAKTPSLGEVIVIVVR